MNKNDFKTERALQNYLDTLSVENVKDECCEDIVYNRNLKNNGGSEIIVKTNLLPKSNCALSNDFQDLPCLPELEKKIINEAKLPIDNHSPDANVGKEDESTERLKQEKDEFLKSQDIYEEKSIWAI